MKKLFGALLALVSSVALATTTVPVQLLNPAGSSSGQTIVSTGASSAPAWATVPLSGLTSIAANTVLANATAASAAPAAFAMPSCSTSSSALNWTTSTGFTCNTIVNAATLSGNAIGTSGATVPLLNGTNTWSGAQTFTSTITPSQTAGIVGTTTNNSANAGSVGEYISATNSAGTSITSGTAANITTISLSAGDWDVSADGALTCSGQNLSNSLLGINTVSAALPPLGNYSQINSGTTLIVSYVAGTPVVRLSLSATTTVYMIAYASFSAGTTTATGVLRARRVR